MISIRNLEFYYSDKKNILHNIDLDISDNEFVILEGNSGIGKSTFLSCLAGFILPNKGKIEIDGINVSDKGNEQCIRKRISYLPQESCMISSLTLLENIYLPKLFNKSVESWECVVEEAKKIIERVGLKGKEKNRPSELSGGEQRRAEIARLLILKNGIVIMDEPTRGMDEECVGILNGILKELKESNVTIIVSTHDERIITDQVDKIYKMNNGKMYEKK